jgi:hypothetical protein
MNEEMVHSQSMRSVRGEDASVATPARPRHRWLRYSLRALLATVLVAALPLWWLRTALDELGAEHEVSETLRSHGVRVGTEPAEPWWFWRRLPKSVAPFRVHAVTIHSNEVAGPLTAADMAAIGRLTRLVQLEIEDSSIADEDLAACRNLVKLKYLKIVNCRNVSDNGLRHFSKATALGALDLRFTNVGDRGMEVVGGFANLDHLDLRYTRVTDGGVPYLLSLNRLWVLYLPRGVTARGLQVIAALTRLSTLGVWLRCADGLAAVEAICQLPGLKVLEISGDAPSDTGFETLGAAAQLRALRIRTSGVNEPSLDKLKALPQFGSLRVYLELSNRSEEDKLYAYGRPIWRNEIREDVLDGVEDNGRPNRPWRRPPAPVARERLSNDSQ